MNTEITGEVKNFGKALVDSMKTISENKVNLALKDRDVQFQTAIEETKKEAEKIAKEAVKSEIETAKKDMFLVFGIFTSFIAFIVGEINILKTIDTIYDKIGFSFIFVSFILGFLFGIMFLLDSQIIEKKYRKMGIVFSLFFLVGVCFLIAPLTSKELITFWL